MIAGLVVAAGVVLMVMIHEAGHFVAAKATGMKATEFFFGFGPKLWSTKRGETEYGVKAIPLGGYVRVVGMNPYEEVEAEDEGRTYREKPFWAKSVVVLAGVASHFVMAFLLFYIVAVIIGTPGPATTTVQQVVAMTSGDASPAMLAGIEPGDTIAVIDGVVIDDWATLGSVVSSRPGQSVIIEVVRNGRPLSVPVTLGERETSDGDVVGFFGIAPTASTTRDNPLAGVVTAGSAIGEASALSVDGMWRVLSGLPQLIADTVNGDEVSPDNRPASPIGLVQIGAATSDQGIGFTLQLLALVNIFVGLFNFLPVYPLDGGHFVVALYEKVRGRKADVRKLVPVAAAVVIFMVLLGALTIFLDITQPLRLN